MPTVAMVVSTIGYHWEEVFSAYKEFKAAGFNIHFYTVNGKSPKPDPNSLKPTWFLHKLGYGVPSKISPDTPAGKELQARLSKVKSVGQLDTNATDILYLPGGHGCLFDVNRNETLQRKIEQLYRNHKILSGVCHATSTFAYVQNHGKPITRNKKITGFPDPLDRILSSAGGVHKNYLPIPFSNDSMLQQAGSKLTDWNKIWATLNPRYTRWDTPFFTGVGPKAAARTARRVIQEYHRYHTVH